MQIHISRDGQQFGPYTLEQVREYLKTGQILPTDQAWYQGAVGWMPVNSVPGLGGAGGPPPIYAGAAGVETEVAYHHVSRLKFIIFSIVSFGLYEIYWFYKNWKYVKQRDDSGIWPVARGIFSLIWCGPLCKDIARNGGSISSGMITLIPLSYFFIYITWRLPDPYWLISIFSFIPLIAVVKQIDEINRERGVEAPYYSRFKVFPIILSVLGGGLLLLSVLSSLNVLPSAAVVAGDKMSTSDLAYLRSAKIIEENEKVLFFYTGGLVSIKDEGNVLTDQRVLTYEKDGGDSKVSVESARFADIKDIEVEWSDSSTDDTVVSISTGEDEGFELQLSAEEKGDRRFVDRLMALWKAERKTESAKPAVEPGTDSQPAAIPAAVQPRKPRPAK